MRRLFTIALVATLIAGPSLAGMAEVVEVRATERADGHAFDVTVRHADEGWEHYADAWRVVLEDGTPLGTRTLFHPHVDEQPFTRSLTGVVIPDGVTRVGVQAHDSVHGWGEIFLLDIE